MRKRPISVTIVSWIYIVAGIGGIAVHWTEFSLRHPFSNDAVLALIVRALAIVAGVFMLRGANWARWLAIVWIAYHVVLSSFHSVPQVAVHTLLLAVFAYVLCRRQANAYFEARRLNATVV
ncbi:MAG TPA: hypothetical protein VJS37_03530 [Terriglobales bacterium]|nr:hypothetical protein [Terriglobales bacterium]